MLAIWIVWILIINFVPLVSVGHPIIDLSKFNPADYPIDDEEERMRRQRAKEMAEGVELAQALQASLSLQENSYKVHSQVSCCQGFQVLLSAG